MRALTLSWPDELDPAADVSIQRFFRVASPTVLLVLAACIGWCWPDPQEPLYPGVPIVEAELLDSIQDLSPASFAATVHSLQVIRGNHQAALRLLCACGFIERSTAEGLVALGPALACWSEADVAVLRAEHHRLPGPHDGMP